MKGICYIRPPDHRGPEATYNKKILFSMFV